MTVEGKVYRTTTSVFWKAIFRPSDFLGQPKQTIDWVICWKNRPLLWNDEKKRNNKSSFEWFRVIFIAFLNFPLCSRAVLEKIHRPWIQHTITKDGWERKIPLVFIFRIGKVNNSVEILSIKFPLKWNHKTKAIVSVLCIYCNVYWRNKFKLTADSVQAITKENISPLVPWRTSLAAEPKCYVPVSMLL